MKLFLKPDRDVPVKIVKVIGWLCVALGYLACIALICVCAASVWVLTDLLDLSTVNVFEYLLLCPIAVVVGACYHYAAAHGHGGLRGLLTRWILIMEVLLAVSLSAVIINYAFSFYMTVIRHGASVDICSRESESHDDRQFPQRETEFLEESQHGEDFGLFAGDEGDDEFEVLEEIIADNMTNQLDDVHQTSDRKVPDGACNVERTRKEKLTNDQLTGIEKGRTALIQHTFAWLPHLVVPAWLLYANSVLLIIVGTRRLHKRMLDG